MTQDQGVPEDLLRQGRARFAALLSHLLTANKFTHATFKDFHDWSNPGAGSWLSTSQISALRTGKLSTPGPRLIDAVANVNLRLAEISGATLLPLDLTMPATKEIPKQFKELTDTATSVVNPKTNLAMNSGDMFMVFCGHLDPQIQDNQYSDRQAQIICAQLAMVAQTWMLKNGKLPLQVKEEILSVYGIKSEDEREKLWAILLGGRPFKGEELSQKVEKILPVCSYFAGQQVDRKDWDHFIATGVCSKVAQLLH